MSFSIRDLENLSGIKSHTIRIWEQRYSFLKPHRTGTNIRNYSNEELKVILNVAFLNKNGYKISRIDKMDQDEIAEKILSLTSTEAQQERSVIELLKNMIDLDIDLFEKNLDDNISSHGIEITITQVIFPFLEKIGVLWQTSHIIPAQEHLVSNVIRRKICVGIDNIKVTSTTSSVCCFLPEGEFHELGLLFIHFLLKSRSVDVIYLGASVPFKDVEYVVEQRSPQFLFTHITTMGQNADFERLMDNLVKRFKNYKVIVTGNMARKFEKKFSSSLIFGNSPYEVVDMICGNCQ